MLVCSVSLKAPRTGSAAITASLTETATALDSLGTGNVVFATLVDDPASILDRVDAYLGEIMKEAASAAATINAGLVYAVRVDEAVTAREVSSVFTPATGAVVETVSAAAVVDATKIAGSRFEGVLALDGPIMPARPQPTVIGIEG